MISTRLTIALSACIFLACPEAFSSSDCAAALLRLESPLGQVEGVTIVTDSERPRLEAYLKRAKVDGARIYNGLYANSNRVMQIRNQALIRDFLSLIVAYNAVDLDFDRLNQMREVRREFFKRNNVYRIDLINAKGKMISIVPIIGQMEYDHGRLVQLNSKGKITDYWFESPSRDPRVSVSVDDFYDYVFSK
jgi:hypothetical protein